MLAIILVCFLMVLASCTNGKESIGDEYNKEKDYPYAFSASSDFVSPSDNGYYFLNGNFIYYMDIEGSPVLLDNRPDHECLGFNSEINCNAYVSSYPSPTLFQFYEGSLYTIENKSFNPGDEDWMEDVEFELVKRSPDGASRQVIGSFTASIIESAVIHRDYLYYDVSYYDENDNYNYELQRLPINNFKKEAETIYKGQHERGVFSITPYGSNIYIIDVSFFKEDKMRFDLTTEEILPFLEQDNDVYANVMRIHKDKMYLNKFPDDFLFGDNADQIDVDKWNTVYETDLDGKNETEFTLKPTDFLIGFYKDDRYTYLQPNTYLNEEMGIATTNEMRIYKDENQIHTVNLEGYGDFATIINGDERYMFMYFYVYEDEESVDFNKSYIYILDKNDIESGEATFKKLIENPHNLKDNFDQDGNPL